MADEDILNDDRFKDIASLVFGKVVETAPYKSVIPQLTIQEKSGPSVLQIPEWFEPLRRYCEDLLDEHPDFSKNVFVMMKFDKGNEQLDEIYDAIKETLALYGLNALRADKRHYIGQLWDNVRTYMLCCQYGIAVLEHLVVNECNPNVTLEYGFMSALNRPTMLLVDKRMIKDLRADITGTIFYSFDVFKIRETVQEMVHEWVRARLGLGFPAP